MELALVLAEATGRRRGAIRQLRWEDDDLEASEVTWRADSEKQGVMWIVPLPAALLAALAEFGRMLGVMSEPKKLRTADVGRRAAAAACEALRRVAANTPKGSSRRGPRRSGPAASGAAESEKLTQKPTHCILTANVARHLT